MFTHTHWEPKTTDTAISSCVYTSEMAQMCCRSRNSSREESLQVWWDGGMVGLIER
jgi:hypothetical protein